MPQAPRYALAVSGWPRSSSSARARRSSPSTYAIFGCRPSLSARSVDCLRESGRVEAAGVADDLDAAVERLAESGLELLEEGPRVPEGRVLQPVPAEDQHGQLGQVVAGQDVERPAGEHLLDRAEPVAVEPGRVADPDRRSVIRTALASRPFPGSPAKAWMIPSHSSASAPSARTARSSRCRRWVASRQKSSAGAVTRCAASSGPQVQVSPSGPVSSTWNGVGRRGAVVEQVGEVAGADGEVRDVPQPVARLAVDAERVEHVLPVRPGLHQPGGRHRGRTHRRAVPEHLLAGRDLLQRLGELGARLAPVRQELVGWQRGGLGRALVHVAGRVGGGLLQRGLEALGIGGGQVRRLVGPGQVGDLMRDRPALGRRRRRPRLGGQPTDEPVQLRALGPQIGQHFVQLHAALPRRGRAAEPGTPAKKNQVCLFSPGRNGRGSAAAVAGRGLRQ